MAHELITVAQMRAIDARMEALGTPTRVLMERAGTAVAAAVAERWAGAPVIVACGPGANGGDGFVAARRLRDGGATVRVALLGKAAQLKGAAAAAAADWAGPIEPLRADAIDPAHVLVDGLFGAGLSRPLEGEAAALAARGLPNVASIDVPSGLPGDGEPPAGPCFQAALIVTFVRKKPAHVLEPGRSLCGAVTVDGIGVPDSVVSEAGPAAFENHPALWLSAYPRPERDAHKHARGHAMVLSGGPTATGAARLAARAALRIGAGLVTVLSPPEAAAVNAAHLTEVMLATFVGAAELERLAGRASALVMGPGAGVGDELVSLVEAVRDRVLVLDADALTSFAATPERLFALPAAGHVLTPHLGEFRRLFPDLAVAGGSKLERTRAAAARAGRCVLLKGPDTVISQAGGRAMVNTTGSPYLATAGSGDVLAGFIGGLAAQGMPIFEASAAAVWLHGRLGERLGPGLIAGDLIEALPGLLRDLFAGAGAL